MTNEPKYREEQWLREQYVNKRRTTREIAKRCGCSDTTVGEWLSRHGIETRSPQDQLPDERLADSEWLREQYVEERRSTYDIAEECGCCKTTIRNYLKEHNIETCSAEIQAPDKRLTDPDWLREQYVEQRRSAKDISEDCGCDPQTVLRWVKRNGIKTHGKGELNLSDPRLKDHDWLYEQYVDKKRDTADIAAELGCSADTVSDWLNTHGIQDGRYNSEHEYRELTDAEWLEEQYVEKGRGMPTIANQCGCDVSTVDYWINKHGIETRIWPGGVTGDDHPLWNGGNQRYGDGWTETKRKAVRERDDHTCQDPRCSVTQADHLDEYDEQLHVHHLRKAREIDDAEERNGTENLITLCRDCHRRWEKIADAGLVPQGVNHASD